MHSRIHNLLESRKLLAERFNTNSILIDKRAAVTESMNKLDNEFLEKINKLIEDRLSSEKIDIGYLSDAMCMSNSTLYRKMKALTGLSTNEYIRKIKMQYAERLLLEGKYNISEVAFKVGINSTVYFRQCFKDEFGMAPSDYLTAAEIVRIPDLSAARILTELEKRGFERLLVEGGPRTLGLFFAEGLVDTLRMAVNPAVRVGDPHAPRFEPPFDPARFPQQRRRLEGMEVTTYTLHPDRTEEDLHYLRQAIALSRRCTPCATSYRVGAVIVTRSGDRFTGYTHETSPTHHAEQEAILKATAAGADLHGASIYSSMEPCSTRSSEPESCSELILRHGFSRTVFALYEPSCFVCCEGAVRLRKGDVEVRVYPQLAGEVRAINGHLGLHE